MDSPRSSLKGGVGEAPPSWSWEECFFIFRYTDDVCAGSNLLVPDCVDFILIIFLLKIIYTTDHDKHLQFDFQYGGQAGPWLDIRLKATSQGNIIFSPYRKTWNFCSRKD